MAFSSTVGTCHDGLDRAKGCVSAAMCSSVCKILKEPCGEQSASVSLKWCQNDHHSRWLGPPPLCWSSQPNCLHNDPSHVVSKAFVRNNKPSEFEVVVVEWAIFKNRCTTTAACGASKINCGNRWR